MNVTFDHNGGFNSPLQIYANFNKKECVWEKNDNFAKAKSAAKSKEKVEFNAF